MEVAEDDVVDGKVGVAGIAVAGGDGVGEDAECV